MADPAFLAVIGAFAVPLAWLKYRYQLRKQELETRRGNGDAGDQEVKRITDENKLLRERVENLESIVCSVDFELNQKLAKVIDEQRSLLLAPAAPAATDNPASAAPTAAAAPAQPGSLDRTATAIAQAAR